MKGFHVRGTKWLAAAGLASTLAFAGVGMMTAEAAGGTTTDKAVKVTYAATTGLDKITVPGYSFYTTVNATKKVPAANQWILTDKGAVDVSSIPGATTLYFAKTSTPASVSDIVAVNIPAAPTLGTAKYVPTASNLDDKFEFTTPIKVMSQVGTKTVTKVTQIPVNKAYIEVKVNDNGAWTAFNTAIKTDTLLRMQHDGATIYARIAPTGAGVATSTTVAYDEALDAYTLTDKNKRFNDESYDASAKAMVRPGVSKTIKIAKRALGPAPVIDYANHCMTVKAGQSYGTNTAAATEPTNWTAVTANEKIYFGTNGTVSGAAQNYGLKTNATAKAPDSLTTFLQVPVDTTLASSSTAAVTGGYETPATLKITNTAAADAYAASVVDGKAVNQAGVAYQYAIVNLTDEATTPLHTEKVNGKLAMIFDYSKTVAWKAVKTNGQGVASVAIPWAQVKDGKQVIVRKAAVGTEYSSQVEVFRAPNSSQACWYKVAQTAYTATFPTAVTGTPCPFVTISYSKDNVFNYTVYGGTAIDNTKVTAKIGKVAGEVTTTFNKNAGTFTVKGAEPVAAAQNVVFTLADGFISQSATGSTSSAISATVTVPAMIDVADGKTTTDTKTKVTSTAFTFTVAGFKSTTTVDKTVLQLKIGKTLIPAENVDISSWKLGVGTIKVTHDEKVDLKGKAVTIVFGKGFVKDALSGDLKTAITKTVSVPE